MKKMLLGAIGVIILVGAIIILKPKTATAPQSQPEITPAASTTTKTITLAELGKHATETDCWLALHGKVYDVSNFISKHPGGKAILEGCGQDATTFFETRPMGTGTPHDDKARDMLPKFEIGDLTQ